MAWLSALPAAMKKSQSVGSGIGSLWAGSMYQNPGDAANEYLGQIGGTITPYYQPYINAGMRALPAMGNQLAKLIGDPSGFYNQMGSGFQASPGYQYNVDQATNAANNVSAAGGMAGTPQEQQQLATTVSGLADQDFNNYINHILGIYKGGMGGLNNINQMGYNASNSLATNLAQALVAQSQAAAMSAAGSNKNNASMIGGVVDSIF